MTLLKLDHIQLAMPKGGEDQARRFSAHPGEVESLRRKDSRQIDILEQILIAKVFNFGGICSRRAAGSCGNGEA